jgi:SHS2 domain-containing protein
MSSQATFVEIEHTADWSICVHGSTLRDLFVNAAVGMYSLMADISTLTPTIERELKVASVDVEALLVRWLNELLYHTEMNGEMFCEFAISSLDSTRIISSAKASRGIELKKQIKAVTFHNLKIVPANDGYEVTLVFDV